MILSEYKLLIAKEDFEILSTYVKAGDGARTFDRKNAESLQQELRKATLLAKEQLPEDVVRINSRVILQEDKDETLMEVVLVLPENADIRQKRISVFAPIGIALLGFRQGESVTWNVPAGVKSFTILRVTNKKS